MRNRRSLRFLAVPLVLVAVSIPAVAQTPATTPSRDSAVADVVRAFYRNAARHEWGEASALFDSSSMARFHARAVLWLTSWAVGHDSLPPSRPGFTPRAPVAPVRLMASLDTAAFRRHADRALPRWAPGTSLAVFARSSPRDVAERLVSLKWSAYPVRALPSFRGILFEGDSIAHALAWWPPADSAGEDPFRATTLHLRRSGDRWRLVAGAPLLYAGDLSTYAVPRPELPPLNTGGIAVSTSPGGAGTMPTMTMARASSLPTDPSLMAPADSAAWANARRALATIATVTPSVPRLELRVGDTIPLARLGMTARDSAGRVVSGFIPAWQIVPGNVARLDMGRVVATAPGEGQITVRGILPPERSGEAVAMRSFPQASIALTVKARPIVRRGGTSSGGSWSTGPDGLFVDSWYSPSSDLVRGDTMFVRVLVAQTADSAITVPIGSCGLRLRPSRGLTLRGSPSDDCPTTGRRLEPGDTLVAEASAIVDADPGSYQLAWSLGDARRAPGSSMSVRVAADTVRAPGSGIPVRTPAVSREPGLRLPRRLPYVIRSRLPQGVPGAPAAADVAGIIREAAFTASSVRLHPVSDTAATRMGATVPYLVITFDAADPTRPQLGAQVVRRVRSADGGWSEVPQCGSRWVDSPFNAHPTGWPSLTRLAMRTRDLVRWLESSECFKNGG